MEISERLKKLPTQFFSALVKKVNNAVAEGRDIINLGQGNPDQPTPAYRQSAANRSRRPENT